jgi:hypothetical protein
MSSLLWAHKQLEGRGKRLAFNNERSNKKHTRTTKMTNDQINAAIAEACGWRKEDGVYMWTANGIDYTCPDLWDWANDLNAMHEAEKTLIGLNRHAFCDMLLDTVADSPDHLWEVLTATARQRAEAFLRTLGKWEEGK